MIHPLYNLTPMTGRRSNEDRMMTVATLEMRPRTFWITLLALFPGLLLAMIFMPLFKEVSFIWVLVVQGIVHFLLNTTSTRGLKLRPYQAILDRRRNRSGVFFLCGRPLDLGAADFGIIRKTSAPVHRPDTTAGKSGTTP